MILNTVRKLLFLYFIAIPLTSHASGLWETGGMAAFCDALPAADERMLHTMLNRHLPAVKREGIDLRRAKIAKPKDFMPLLSRATRLGWGPLEFFSAAEFARKDSCILLLDRQTLQQLNDKYDIHALWMVSAPLEDKHTLDMELLLLGQGKLIIVYPRPAIVRVKDYDLWTGQYSYQTYTSMGIVNNGQTRGLVNIKTLAKPDSDWLPFEGPLGADIHSLEVQPGHIRVSYFKFFEATDQIRKIPIALR